MKKFKAKTVDHGFKVKHAKNKKTKVVLTFDEQARKEWLTGFSKRKQERKQKAHDAEIARLKEEKRQLKIKKREERERQRQEYAVPEMERLFEKETKHYNLPDHLVQITDVAEIDFVGSTGTMLGSNMNGSDEEEEQESEDTNQAQDQTQTEKRPSKHSHNKLKGKKPSSRRKHVNKTHLMAKKKGRHGIQSKPKKKPRNKGKAPP